MGWSRLCRWTWKFATESVIECHALQHNELIRRQRGGRFEVNQLNHFETQLGRPLQ